MLSADRKPGAAFLALCAACMRAGRARKAEVGLCVAAATSRGIMHFEAAAAVRGGNGAGDTQSSNKDP